MLASEVIIVSVDFRRPEAGARIEWGRSGRKKFRFNLT
jgi:hypothetical protein